MGIIGRHSFELCSRPRIISSASYVGDKEGKGPLRECFDKICRDDTLGLDSWEQAESRMFESAVRVALAKIKRQSDDLSCLLGGDLLNQIISSGFAAREIRAPFIGLYGACSTISEGLMLGGMLVDGGFAELAACAASSHFSAAERQFRYPLEMGVQAVPSSQRTVTGAGSIIIQAAGEFRPVRAMCLNMLHLQAAPSAAWRISALRMQIIWGRRWLLPRLKRLRLIFRITRAGWRITTG